MLVIDDSELSRGDALNAFFASHGISVFIVCQNSLHETVRVPYFEGDRNLRQLFPRIGGDEVEILHPEGMPVLQGRVISVCHIKDVPFDVLADDKPGTSAESQAFPLPYGVEPVAIVCAYFFPLPASMTSPCLSPRNLRIKSL